MEFPTTLRADISIEMTETVEDPDLLVEALAEHSDADREEFIEAAEDHFAEVVVEEVMPVGEEDVTVEVEEVNADA